MIITFANFKGGVGKTTATALFTYLLASDNKKVLCIDTDPQANLTETLELTFKKNLDPKQNIFNGLFSNNDISSCIQSLSNSLDILSGSWDMVNFEKEADNIYYKSDFHKIIQFNLKDIKNNYDYILIDTAPATNIVMDNVILATDQVIITTQSVPLAYESTKKFYNYLLDRYNDDDYNFELLGVLPYLVGKSATDRDMLKKYNEVFEDELFINVIRQSDRVKTWSNYGITKDQPYDKVTLKMYQNVVDEVLNKLKERGK